ncbi:MAG: DUF2807 domain-containing protein [Bacteroidales bacterium]
MNYVYGSEHAITIEAESNILPFIETKIRAGSPEIRALPGTLCLNYARRPVVTVTAPPVSEIVNAGSGDFIADQHSGTGVRLVNSGSGDITAGAITGSEVSLVVSGSGNVMTDDVATNSMKATLSGSGKINLIPVAVKETVLQEMV